MTRTGLGLLGATGLGLVAAWVLLTPKSDADAAPSTMASSPKAQPPTAPPSAEPPPRTGPLTAALGINEAVSIPKAWVDKGVLSPERQTRMLSERAHLSHDLGATWVRGNSPVYPYLDMQTVVARGWDWSQPDRWVGVLQEAGLDAIVVLGPWPGNRTAAFTDHYLPDDMDAYADYVRRVVERYDGDGVDDMPGLTRPIKAWEVDNEPDLHNSAPPRGARGRGDPSHFETPQEYAQVLIATGAAVRQADPEATVLSGGLFRLHSAEGESYLRRVLAQDGAIDAFDVLSVHAYSDANNLDTVTRTLDHAHLLAPGKPVWLTETGVPADGRRPWATEDWQAAMVAAIIGGALADGADKIFWHTLADPPRSTEHRRHASFSTHSLLRTLPGPHGGPGGPREDKPAGVVFRALSQVFEGAALSDVREVEARGGRLLWTGTGWLAFWGAPALPEGAGQPLDLRTGQPRAPHDGKITAPAWIPQG